MIRLATSAGDTAALRAIARRTPCLGARVLVDMQVAADNPKMPYRFYRAGAGALLELTGRGAVACGTPRDSEEAALFLYSMGATRLLSDGWVPEGWSAARLEAMGRPAETPAGQSAALRPFSAPAQPDEPPPPGFEPEPTMAEVLSVLESSDGPLRPEAARDGFIADVSARRSRGLAVVMGVRQQGRLVCTAGIYALAGHEAYIACVETLPAARGQGLARALVRLLCRRAGGRAVSLMCEGRLMPFYAPLGFVPLRKTLVMAGAPGG